MRLSFIQNYRLLWALLIILGLSSGAQAQYVQTKSVVDSAGGSSKASGYTNISAIGQPFNFNEGSNGGYNNRGGFLHGGILSGGNNSAFWRKVVGVTDVLDTCVLNNGAVIALCGSQEIEGQMFLIKIGADGEIDWLNTISNSRRGILGASKSSGNSYIILDNKVSSKLNNDKLLSGNFLMFDSSGKLGWEAAIPYAWSKDIEINNNGEIYIAGNVHGTLKISTPASNYQSENQGFWPSSFLAIIQPNSTIKTVYIFGGPNENIKVTELALDNSGNIFMSGAGHGSSGGADVPERVFGKRFKGNFIVKLNSSIEPLWLQSYRPDFGGGFPESFFSDL